MAVTFVFGLKAQEVKDEYKSIGTIILERVKDEKLSIGGYCEIHYNQQVSGYTRYNGNMDVHRMVLFFCYQFNDKTYFLNFGVGVWF
jgi:hypothetical protein